jgi:hypothetical protein
MSRIARSDGRVPSADERVSNSEANPSSIARNWLTRGAAAVAERDLRNERRFGSKLMVLA